MSHSSHLNQHELDGAASDSDEGSALSRHPKVEAIDLADGQSVEAGSVHQSVASEIGPAGSPSLQYEDTTQATEDTTTLQTPTSIPTQRQAQDDPLPPQQQKNPRRQGYQRRNNIHYIGGNGVNIVHNAGRTPNGGTTISSFDNGRTWTGYDHNSGRYVFSTGNPGFVSTSSQTPLNVTINHDTPYHRKNTKISINADGVHVSVHRHRDSGNTFHIHNSGPQVDTRTGSSSSYQTSTGFTQSHATPNAAESSSWNRESSSSADDATGGSPSDANAPGITVSTDRAAVRSAAERWGATSNSYIPPNARYQKIGGDGPGSYVQHNNGPIRKVG